MMIDPEFKKIPLCIVILEKDSMKALVVPFLLAALALIWLYPTLHSRDQSQDISQQYSCGNNRPERFPSPLLTHQDTLRFHLMNQTIDNE